MPKLKLGAIESDKPVRVMVELPATIHRDLLAYAKAHAQQTGQSELEPAKLIAPMLQRLMATDRGFSKFHQRTNRPTRGTQSDEMS